MPLPVGPGDTVCTKISKRDWRVLQALKGSKGGHAHKLTVGAMLEEIVDYWLDNSEKGKLIKQLLELD